MSNIKVNKFKKAYRIICKYLLIFFIKITEPIYRLLGITINPPYNKVDNFNFTYSNQTRRLVFDIKKKETFNKIFIDTTLSNTSLCEIGKKFSTNKSSNNIEGHRSGFTGFYNLLFSNLRDKQINFAEIGIEKNSSIKMWRDFFPQASIHAFEFEEKKIENAKKDNLTNTTYHKIDVRDNSSIINSFKKTKLLFDIIIDDSTHIFDDQIKIVNNCKNFLNNNGILVLEDIYRFRKGYSEKDYYNSLKNIKNYFNEITFVETSHINNYTGSWKNEKILLFIKNE